MRSPAAYGGTDRRVRRRGRPARVSPSAPCRRPAPAIPRPSRPAAPVHVERSSSAGRSRSRDTGPRCARHRDCSAARAESIMDGVSVRLRARPHARAGAGGPRGQGDDRQPPEWLQDWGGRWEPSSRTACGRRRASSRSRARTEACNPRQARNARSSCAGRRRTRAPGAAPMWAMRPRPDSGG